MNKILLVGNVITKIESKKVKVFGRDSYVASFKLRVDDLEAKKTDCINCIVGGNSASFASDAIHKGDLVSVEGALRSKEKVDENSELTLQYEVQVEKLHRLSNKTIDDGKEH